MAMRASLLDVAMHGFRNLCVRNLLVMHDRHRDIPRFCGREAFREDARTILLRVDVLRAYVPAFCTNSYETRRIDVVLPFKAM